MTQARFDALRARGLIRPRAPALAGRRNDLTALGQVIAVRA